MGTLAYERRRLTGLRSSWLVLAATVVGAALFTVVTAGHGAGASFSAARTAGRLAAVPSSLPLPFAAFGAGVVGALSYAHELRHPALRPCLLRPGRRWRLLAAKLLVVGAAAASLTVVTVLVDAVVVHFAAPGGLERIGVGHGHRLPTGLWQPLVLAVAAGWVCLLVCGLVRSAVAGVLVLPLLALLPRLVTHPVAQALHRGGAGQRPLTAASVAPVLVPGLAVLLLAVWSGVQLRRRGL